MMRYAYVKPSTFQADIYKSELLSKTGEFKLIWRWKVTEDLNVQIIRQYILNLLEAYEILRTSICEYNGSIQQKISETYFTEQIQVIPSIKLDYLKSSNYLKQLAKDVHGCCFIIVSNNNSSVLDIFGIANHAIIDAYSIYLLKEQLNNLLVNSTNLDEQFQFADYIENINNITSNQESFDSIFNHKEQDHSSLNQSIYLDCNNSLSHVTMRSNILIKEFNDWSHQQAGLTDLAKIFYWTFKRIAYFLNSSNLKVGIVLDARPFLGITKLIGPALIIRKASFDVDQFLISGLKDIMSFLYDSNCQNNYSSHFHPCDDIDVLFNFFIEHEKKISHRDYLVDVPYTNTHGANVPLTIEFIYNKDLLRFNLMLRSNSLSLPEVRLGQLSDYIIGKYTPECTSYLPEPTPNISNLLLNSFEINYSKIALTIVTSSSKKDYTYHELQQRISLFRAALDASLTEKSFVLVSLVNPFDILASIFAIVLSGHVYVPLDSRRRNDLKRVEQIKSYSNAEFILDQFSNPLLISNSEYVPSQDCLHGIEYDVCLMFTSGSTGDPKGVRIASHGIYRLLLLAHRNDWHGLKYLMHSDIGFDASLMEIWIPILTGGQVIYIDYLQLLSEGITDEVDWCWMSVSMLRQVLKNSNNIQKAKVICTGGEHVPFSLVELVKKSGFFKSNNRLFNGYGPTESTTFVFLDEINPDQYKVSEGVMKSLLPRTQVHLINRFGLQVPIGSIGELVVQGDGVSLGYINQESISGFLVSNDLKSRQYNTGDYFQRLDHKTFKFIGRADDQLKISGYRTSFDQICSLIKNYLPNYEPILVKTILDNNLSIIAFVPVDYISDINTFDSIISQMHSTVPHYLVPKAIIPIRDVPLTSNGKVDRKMLLDLYFHKFSSTSNAISNLITNKKVIQLILNKYTDHSNHYISHLTHNSLELVSLHSLLCEYGFEIDLHELSTCKTIDDLTKYINHSKLLTFLNRNLLLDETLSGSLGVVQLSVPDIHFDLIKISSYFVALYDLFGVNLSKPFQVKSSCFNINDRDACKQLFDDLNDFPIMCCYQNEISSSKVILYIDSSLLSLHYIHFISQNLSDYLLLKGSIANRLSKLSKQIEISKLAYHTFFHETSFLLKTIHQSILMLSIDKSHRVFALLPCDNLACSADLLYQYIDCQLILVEYPCNFSDNDVLFSINKYNDSLRFKFKLSSLQYVEGDLSRRYLTWSLGHIILRFASPFPLDHGNLDKLAVEPVIWTSKQNESSQCIVIISPVADDLAPVISIAKEFSSVGYTVIAITTGLLADPSQDSLVKQASRLLNQLAAIRFDIILGYSYSGILVNYIASTFHDLCHKCIIIDTPNPLLIQHELQIISDEDNFYWLTQVVRRLLKSVDSHDAAIDRIVNFISKSCDFNSCISNIRYQLIEAGAISYSVGIDDLLRFIKAAKYQFFIYKNYRLQQVLKTVVFIKAKNSNISSELSWDLYCSSLDVINVNADHYSIIKASTIKKYIHSVVEALS